MIKSMLIISYEEVRMYIGLNTRVFGIASALMQKGIRVEVAAPSFSSESERETSQGPSPVITYIRLPRFGSIPIVSRCLFVIFFTIKVWRNYRKKINSYEAIQTEQIYSTFAGLLLKSRYKIPLIIDDPTMLSNFIDTRFSLFKPIKYLLKIVVKITEGAVFKTADYIFCSSKKSMIYVKNVSGIISSNVVYFPNGVNTNIFMCCKREGFESRIFLNCSLPYYQNLAALENLRKILIYFEEKKFIDYSCALIVNNISLIPKDLSEFFFENNRVRIYEAVSSLIPYFNNADIVVLPYEKGHFLTAGARLKAVEALSCGKVVLSTAEGVDGVDGLVDGRNFIKCEDWKDIADKIIGLAKDSAETREACLNTIEAEARKLVLEKYGWNSLVDAYNLIKG